MIWCLGMLFSILPANKASFAISYGLGQGATMIAAAWGVFIWKEFRDAREKPKTYFLLTVMFVSFIFVLNVVIIGSNEIQTGGIRFEEEIKKLAPDCGLSLDKMLHKPIRGIQNSMAEEFVIFMRKVSS